MGDPKKDSNNAVKELGTEDPEKKPRQPNGSTAQRDDQQEDRLLQAVKGMRDVQARLAQGKSDAITRHVQRQVVADLQQIIDEAKKSGKCLGQPMAANCNNPAKPGGSPNARPKSNTANDRPTGDSDPNAKHEPKQPSAERRLLAIK